MTKAEEILEKHLVDYDTISYTEEDRKLKQCYINAINEALTIPDVVKSFYCWNSKCDGKKCKNQCMGCEYYEEKELKQ